MPEAITSFADTTFGQVVIGVIVTIVAGVIVAVGHRLWRMLGALGTFLDDWRGEPARGNFPARPGVMDRLDRLETQGDARGEALHTLKQQMADITDELPRNGVPVGKKIDALWTKFLDDQERAHAALNEMEHG